jgi:hypothetical protein
MLSDYMLSVFFFLENYQLGNENPLEACDSAGNYQLIDGVPSSFKLVRTSMIKMFRKSCERCPFSGFSG